MSLQSTYDEQVSAMATMLAQQVGSLDNATPVSYTHLTLPTSDLV